MKIHFCTSFRLPNERGVSYGIVAMCQALSQAGNKVELVGPNRVQTPLMKNKDIWSYHQIKKNSFTFTKLPYLEWRLPHLYYFILNWSFAFCAAFYLISQKAKVVHLFNDARELLVILWAVQFIFRPKVVFELHLLPLNSYETLLEQLSFSRIDLLLVTTRRFADYYRKICQEIIVFPNGININEFDFRTPKSKLRRILGLPIKSFIVGYAGRFVTMNMEKGIPELIQAAKALHRKFPHLLLLCVGGPDEYVKKYQKEAHQAGLSNLRAIFIGDVPRSKLYQYMRAFDICAMPFPWTEHFAFNMSPLKSFEYMASNNPIIATDLPSLREIFTDNKNSLLAKPGDYKSLAEKIAMLIASPVLGKRLAKEARREVIKKYTWKKRAQSETQFLEKSFRY